MVVAMNNERTGKKAANHAVRHHAGTKCYLMDYLGLNEPSSVRRRISKNQISITIVCSKVEQNQLLRACS